MKQILRNLIANGKTAQALEELRRLNLADEDLNTQTNLLSARFARYQEQKNMGVADERDLNTELNRINVALLALVNELPDADGAENGTTSPPSVTPTPTNPPIVNNNPPEPTPTDNKLVFGISIVFLLLMVGITLFKPEWTSQQPTLFKVLLALAAAGFVALLPGFLNYEVNSGLKAGGALAAFVLVYLVNPATDTQPFDMTVNVHGRNGKMDNVLKNEGMVHVRLVDKDFRDSAKIGEGGEAVFKKLSPQYKAQKAYLSVDAKVYEAKDANQLYLTAEKVDVEVKTKNLSRVWGTVRADGQFVADVEIRLGEQTTKSDASGKFSFTVPIEQQKPEMTIIAQKPGYRSLTGSPIYEVKIYPSTLSDDGLKIMLMKNKK